MESIMKESGSVKGTEVLFFQNATVEKIKGTTTSFASAGSLSVLYFSDYHRFVLQINDWKFPLLRRLPIVASKGDLSSSRSYLMPALNGFFFRLRIDDISNLQPIDNLETIFSNSSNFSIKGQDTPFKKLEASPDDKLVRSAHKDTSIKDIISEKIKHATDKVKITTKTLTTGTKYLTSTKKRIDLKKLSNKNFRKTAKSTFKKNFFESSEKVSKEFLEMRRLNANLSETHEFKDLLKTSKLPSLYIPREDIEEAILDNKDLAAKGNFNMTMSEERRVPADIKEGFAGIKEELAQKFGRERRVEIKEEKLAGTEGMIHYQA